MIYKNEIEEVVNSFDLKDEFPEAWIILINGKVFKTSGSKKNLWRKKRYASRAFRMDVEHKIQRIVRGRIINSPDWDGGKYGYYTNKDYENAYEDFKKYLIDNGILEFVKVI